MSNSNNPFLSHLTGESASGNQNNNNKPKDDNDLSKILEEGSASAVPPPAYDEIVKPQPAQPGSEYPAYPPPPFSPPEMPVRENYNQSNQYQSPNVYMNSNKRRGFNPCFCCSGGSQRSKSCGCGWIIVLIIFIILGTISLINNRICNNLTLGETPENFSFDLSANSIFRINTDDVRIKSGRVRVQNPQLQGNNSQIVNVQVFTGSSGITPKFDTSSRNGLFELKIIQTGFSILNIPPRCMISRIDVNLPPQSSFPSTIQVNDLDISLEQNNAQQSINLTTNNGDIILTNVTAQSINLNTNNGDIEGSITSISDRLNIQTNDGDTELYLGNAQTHFNSKTSIKTHDGSVALIFNGSSFSGNYDIKAYNGRIQVDGNHIYKYQYSGTVGNNGNGTLNITTNNGDVRVVFQETKI